MKNIFLVTLAIASSMSMADVDYRRCLQATGDYSGMGYYVDNDGKIMPPYGQTLKDKTTEGNTEKFVFEGQLGNKKFTTHLKIQRDAQGRIIKMINGPETIDEEAQKEFRRNMVDVSVAMSPIHVNAGAFGGNHFMSQEPHYWVTKKDFKGTGLDKEMVSLSKLTQDQAREVGINNPEELRRLRGQWRRDKRTVGRLRRGYEDVVNKSSLVIPAGTESEFEIIDGVCVPKVTRARIYNSQLKQVVTFETSSKERCDVVNNLYKKYETKINECQATNHQIMADFFREVGSPMMGGMQGGMVSGGFGGLVGGIQGGMMGTTNTMEFIGDINSLQMHKQRCDGIYGIVTTPMPFLTPPAPAPTLQQ